MVGSAPRNIHQGSSHAPSLASDMMRLLAMLSCGTALITTVVYAQKNAYVGSVCNPYTGGGYYCNEVNPTATTTTLCAPQDGGQVICGGDGANCCTDADCVSKSHSPEQEK